MNKEDRTPRPRRDKPIDVNFAEDQAPVINEEVSYTVKTKTGVVTGCKMLNVREAPNANCKVVCVINENSEVIIDDDGSTDDWFKVCAENGAEGFCMKKFINVNS